MVLIFKAISMVMFGESDLIRMNFKLSRNVESCIGTTYFYIYHLAAIVLGTFLRHFLDSRLTLLALNETLVSEKKQI